MKKIDQELCVSFGILRPACANVSFRTYIKFSWHIIKMHFENQGKGYVKNR